MKKRIKLFSIVALSAILLTACGNKNGAEAPNKEGGVDWPKKPVNVVLHAAAGGDTDFNARTFAEYFEKVTGQPMVVTNMPGASGTASTEHVKQSAPDGYTALFVHTGPLIVNKVSGLIDYNFTAFDVASIPAVDEGTVLVLSKKSGITSVKQLVEKLKAEPESVVLGTEFGNYSHLQALMIEDAAGIKFKAVDVGSAADKITNLLGGRIDCSIITYGTVKDYLQTGDMVAVAQFGEEKNPNLGDIPTLKESGVDVAMDKPYIIAFPKGTDPQIVEKMSEVSLEIAKNPEYAEKLKKGFNQEAKAYGKDEAIERLQKQEDEFMKYQEILKKAN